jgi:hypothetical protein
VRTAKPVPRATAPRSSSPPDPCWIPRSTHPRKPGLARRRVPTRQSAGALERLPHRTEEALTPSTGALGPGGTTSHRPSRPLQRPPGLVESSLVFARASSGSGVRSVARTRVRVRLWIGVRVRFGGSVVVVVTPTAASGDLSPARAIQNVGASPPMPQRVSGAHLGHRTARCVDFALALFVPVCLAGPRHHHVSIGDPLTFALVDTRLLNFQHAIRALSPRVGPGLLVLPPLPGVTRVVVVFVRIRLPLGPARSSSRGAQSSTGSRRVRKRRCAADDHHRPAERDTLLMHSGKHGHDELRMRRFEHAGTGTHGATARCLQATQGARRSIRARIRAASMSAPDELRTLITTRTKSWPGVEVANAVP